MNMHSSRISSASTPRVVLAVAVSCLFSGAQILFAADAPPAGPRGGRGAPLTVEDQAAIAKLSGLPTWKAGAADGDYSIALPYAPAPENAVREGVPQGKVITFRMDMAGSKFFPPTPGRDDAPPATREVNV